MKKLYFVIISFFLTVSVFAQPNGNEWIVYGQKYYYFKIYQDGIHRIDYNTLVAAGVDVATINPKNLQVFGRERELYIHVEGESDNTFDPGDFIEFYATHNDGWLDSLVYDGGAAAMPDQYYSLYNDTIFYYLTWNVSTSNRRMKVETDSNYSAYTSVPWFWFRRYSSFKDSYLYGELSTGASSSKLKPAEGWFSGPYNAIWNDQLAQAYNTFGFYNGVGAPDATVNVTTAGGSNANLGNPPAPGNHHLRIRYGSSQTLAVDTVYTGYQLIKNQFTVPNSEGGNTTNIYIQFIGDLGVASDYQHIASFSFTYPRSVNLGGDSKLEIGLPFNTAESKTRLSFTSVGSSPPYYLYDITDTVKRIPVIPNFIAGAYEALVPNLASGSEAKCFLTSTNEIIPVTELIFINGTGGFTNYAAMNIDSAYIILSHPRVMAGATAYGNYRSSAAGGGYNVAVIDAEELYHQYGGGIYKHGLALRRFCKDMMEEWSSAPQFLFLIGKSIREATEGNYAGTRKDTSYFNNNLVPSFGYPPSDNLITAGLDGDDLKPAIPTGRLSATNDQQVLDYLTKMTEYELLQDPNSVYSIEEKAWMKEIQHFGGGSSTNEQALFESFLYAFELIAEDTLFGANVSTYLKTTSQPINPVEYDEVMTQIKEGIAVMTFYGHSSVSGFDQNLDEPENWENGNGRYPFLIGNACYTGDIHQPSQVSASENFVLEPGKGVIGFLASVKLGFTGPLFTFSHQFYQEMSVYQYGKPVGLLFQHTIDSIQYINIGFIPMENACTQVTLHGDPALKIHSHPAPEFEVRTQDIYFEPSDISLAVDSFDVNVIITNIGRASTDSILVELTRGFPGGVDSVYTTFMNGLNFKDTIVFRLPVQHNIAVGINTFDVAVDIPSFVNEHYDDQNNNMTSTTLFINSNAVSPVYPYEFAIVPDSVLTFKASTYNPIAAVRNYRFEVDTSSNFDSPEKRFQVVTSAGGVVTAASSNWVLASNSSVSPLVFTDSTVYFWRVSPDSTVYYWLESSFQYISGLTGWGQAHFDQFERDYHQTINYDTLNAGWTWSPNLRKISCNVYGDPQNWTEMSGTNFFLDNDMQEAAGMSSFYPAVHVAVIDPITLESWGTYGCDPTLGGSCSGGTCTMINANHQFGNANDGCNYLGRTERNFIFQVHTDPGIDVQRDSLVSMYTNHIPDGSFVLFYSWIKPNYTDWTPAMFTMFNSTIGVDSIYPGAEEKPFIILARKGDPSFTQYVIGDTINDFISFVDTLQGFDYIGSIKTMTAGPASEWNALYWQQNSLDIPVSTDSARISLYGIKADGTEDLLFDNLFTSLDSLMSLNTIMDASVYPYAKLKGWFKDTVNFTPAQIKRWQLVYTPAPEAAVNGALGYYFSAISDTLDEGQDISFAIAVENISEYDMDSLLVHYWIEDANRVKNFLSYPRQDSLRAGQILFDTVTFSTNGFPGLNSFWMEVNPVPIPVVMQAYDQPEQYHFNNFAQVPFFIDRDITNPILDVTFDGIHILNGDIVSPKPQILITLKDENPWLVMNSDEDTANFSVYITDPNGSQDRVYFYEGGQQQLIWTSATTAADKFKIEYYPQFTLDGKYELLIQANDKSGNLSGTLTAEKAYKIEFEVVTKPSITEFMNYPNPFTTKTHFVFTLTGSEVPQYMKIQIMTVTGKVVKEITQDELGTVRIGRNITDYYWDGTDEFGDRLANGVYLYRVIVKLNGEDMEKRESGADAYFRKGFGKMYLMR